MSEKQRMLQQKLYNSFDEELQSMQKRRSEFLEQFNKTHYADFQSREKLVKSIFKKVGKNCIINKPFHCDYGCHISVGDNFYANFDCIFLDVNEIIIGNNVMLAPRVCLYTAGHPIDKDVRNIPLEYGYPIHIGNDVWIGGNTIINPGITIGDNVVIGSGSVVTHDIPSNVVAAGVPCQVLRPITSEDKKKWLQQKGEYDNLKKFD